MLAPSLELSELAVFGPLRKHSQLEGRHLVAEQLQDLRLLHVKCLPLFAHENIRNQLELLKVQLNWQSKLLQVWLERVSIAGERVKAFFQEDCVGGFLTGSREIFDLVL